MTQPREHKVRCHGLCGGHTASVSGLCDKCSPHGGPCDLCGDLAERRYAVRVPLDGWNFSEERFCRACAAESGQHDGLVAA